MLFSASEVLTSQPDKLRGLRGGKNRDVLVSVRAGMQYVGTLTRPDVCAPFQLFAGLVSAVNVDAVAVQEMKELVCVCHRTTDEGLKYVPLDLESLHALFMVYASFANNSDCRSQVGFVILLVDKHNNTNIIHYGSKICVRITRSVMATEICALVFGFDQAVVLADILGVVFERQFKIGGYLDSKTVFDTVTRPSPTLEKQLLIDVHGVQEAHQSDILTLLSCIESAENMADSLTKAGWQSTNALRRLKNDTTLRVEPTGWWRQVENFAGSRSSNN